MTQSRSESTANQASTGEGRLVQGSLWNAIWTMSWPLLLMTTSASLIGLVDMQVAGKLGSIQQAAVGVSEQCIFLFMIFIMSISVGTTALVSRAAGAGNHGEAVQSAAQSLTLSFCMGIILCILSLCCAQYGLQLFSQAPDVVAIGKRYLGIYSLFLLPFSIGSIINASFRAVGDAKTPLVIVGCQTVVNIALDYATVLGNWPVPNLGLSGLAISGITANSIGAVIGLILLSRSQLSGALKRLWPVFPSYVKRILKVGFPSAIQRLGWSMSVFVLFFILTQCAHPPQAIAAWTIGMRVEGLIFMPLMALSLSVSSIVGQNLGAQRYDRAISAGWKVTWIGVVLMVIMGTVLFIFAPQFANMMSTDPETIHFVTDYLRINALSEPFLSLGMVLGGALQGAGDTRTPMLITLCCHWGIRLPLAYFFALQMHMGPNGAWIAMNISVILMGLFTSWWFQSKKWLKTQV
ncbi:MAG TPA: MATE family efflux transporter [Planktothrix sp.]|jgi:putative MATE family efflux protein